MARTPSPVNLVLTLSDDGTPLRHQIADAILRDIGSGQIEPGDALPATRSLALALDVPRSAVVDAYDEMAAAGFVIAIPGGRTEIALGADRAVRAGQTSHVTAAVTERQSDQVDPGTARWNLRPGFPDVGILSGSDWRRAWRVASADPATTLIEPRAMQRRLRQALSSHLRRTRGVVADESEIFLVPGVASALRTLADAAGLSGKAVAYENPGWDAGRIVLSRAGALVRSVPVDREGIDTAQLRDTDAAVYVTPAHQFPIGARLSPTRRATLIEWATTNGSLLIEDDYDGEFRYDVAPLPTLASTAEGRDVVAYMGTASKLMTPGVRLAWLIPPPHLRDAVRQSLRLSEEATCTVTANAMAEFMDSGSLVRHLARASRTYRARRRAFVRALRNELPEFEVIGIEAGLHVFLRLPPETNIDAIVRECEQRGVAVRGLEDFAVGSTEFNGLVLGYGMLPESRADSVVATVADVIRGELPGHAST